MLLLDSRIRGRPLYRRFNPRRDPPGSLARSRRISHPGNRRLVLVVNRHGSLQCDQVPSLVEHRRIVHLCNLPHDQVFNRARVHQDNLPFNQTHALVHNQLLNLRKYLPIYQPVNLQDNRIRYRRLNQAFSRRRGLLHSLLLSLCGDLQASRRHSQVLSPQVNRYVALQGSLLDNPVCSLRLNRICVLHHYPQGSRT